MTHNIDVHKVFADCFQEKMVRAAAYAVSQKLSEGHICVDLQRYNQELRDAHIAMRVDEGDIGDAKVAKSDVIQDGVSQVDVMSSASVSSINPFLLSGELLSGDDLLKSPYVSQCADNVQPFVLFHDRIYLQRYFMYETQIVESIGESMRLKKSESLACQKVEGIDGLKRLREFVQDLFTGSEDVDEGLAAEERVNWQLVAAITAIVRKFSIITGGPGTGKTTTVAKILAILYRMNPTLRVALAAPTGKAAARMVESLKSARENISVLTPQIKEQFDRIEAGTIHRLLGYIKGSPYFRHNVENPLEYDVVIVDESSMISAPLMAKLLTAVNPNNKVILLGDKNQLASVEAGSVFGDICLSLRGGVNHFSQSYVQFVNGFINADKGKIPSDFVMDQPMVNPLQENIVELKRSHRFKSNMGIGKFSKAIIMGNMEVYDFSFHQKSHDMDKGNDGKNNAQEYVLVEDNYQSPALYSLIDKYKTYILEKDIRKALHHLNDVRFLCAIREGKFGVNNYNNLIENYMERQGVLKPTVGFYENQPIMITQNDYSLDLFNGDVGLIRKDEDGNLKAWFEAPDGSVKRIIPGFINSFETVFAMTIHKSQGSEFTSVAVVLPTDEDVPILTRELLYTGVTRGKKEVVIFGSQKVIVGASNRQVARASGITERIIKN